MPDELDPQIREFTSQLRRLVDRSGLSIASVADRTGYSKTSWERYLNGRLLAPKGAIVALAEVTGTNPVHLTTMWELAERAWSRSEMRHDMTMEAIRISQARAALGEFGGQDFTDPSAGGKAASAGEGRAASAGGGKPARRSGGTTVTPGIAGPAGVAPAVPPQPTAPEVQDSSGADVREGSDRAAAPEVNSWGLAGYQGPSPAGGRSAGPGADRGSRPGSGSGTSAGSPGGRTPGAGAGSYGEPQDAVPARAGGAGGSGAGGTRRAPSAPAGKKRTATFVAGVVGVLVVIAGAFYLTGGGGDDEAKGGAKSPSPTVSTDPKLPPGVKCSGADCTGKDAEAMGCSGDLVTTAQTATVGTTVVEVRYSETCKAAWGRITQAAQGDEVQISSGKAKQTGSITAAGDTVAYTPMVAVKGAADAKACAILTAGGKGCTD
ncbi:helix-turn-helix domain-containing protein [Streptomyces paradoxus]|uniref:Transcriptional regulator with XRE-family HTH domain n=1 Tax=Streptomyces paradoxus TaxID=66375 RepID=A0A7W9TA78_9ACTN|nr:XRE family transcriptional regulator [Streptomyces paradoxus]MBB6076436.1 transcriptional regulator with XRE-family HTH domain [Streptomyces paradoxus]